MKKSPEYVSTQSKIFPSSVIRRVGVSTGVVVLEMLHVVILADNVPALGVVRNGWSGIDLCATGFIDGRSHVGVLFIDVDGNLILKKQRREQREIDTNGFKGENTRIAPLIVCPKHTK